MAAWLWQTYGKIMVWGSWTRYLTCVNRGFPIHPSNVLDTSSVSYSPTQSWHCLPGYSVRSSQVRAWSHKAAALTSSDASHKPRLLLMLPIYRLQIGGSMTSSLDSINLLENFTELSKTFYLQDHWFIIKGYNRKSQMEEVHKRKDMELPRTLWVHHSPQISACSPTAKFFSTPSFWGFMEASLHRHNGWIIGPWWLKSITSPSLFPRRGEGRAWKFQPSNHLVGSPGIQLLTLDGVQMSPINITKDAFLLSSPRKFKGFRSSETKLGMKTKLIFLIINHNITKWQIRNWIKDGSVQILTVL